MRQKKMARDRVYATKHASTSQFCICRWSRYYNGLMSHPVWPDPLDRPHLQAIQQHLTGFWYELAKLPELLERQEYLLAEHCTATLRATIIEMMLALNGIAYPTG